MSQNSLDRRQFLLTSLSLGLGIPGLLNGLPAKAQERRFRAAACTAGMAGTWNQQGKAASELWCKWLGVDLSWYDGGWDVPTQLAAMNDIVSRKFDFVAVQPCSIGALIEPIQALIKAGVPVIDMDTLIAPLPTIKQLGVLTFIAPDNVALAEDVVQKLVNKMGGQGKIAHTWGQQGHTGAQGRAQGFYNVMQKYPNIEVVDDQAADWLVERATEIWEILLKRHPDLNAGFLHNDDMALAARGVVEKAGLENQIVLAGIDGMVPALEAVRDGKLLATGRNSAPRIHGWAMVLGYYAATVGLDMAYQTVPPFILADGGVTSFESNGQGDARLFEEPWKVRHYGQSEIEGQIWAQTQMLY